MNDANPRIVNRMFFSFIREAHHVILIGVLQFMRSDVSFDFIRPCLQTINTGSGPKPKSANVGPDPANVGPHPTEVGPMPTKLGPSREAGR